MAAFPKLRTGAIAQYPVTRILRFQNQVLRFVDGAEQRYRDSRGLLHQWNIQLDALDEGELAALEAFFMENEGRYGNFTFTDPRDGCVYANCSLRADELETTSLQEMRGRTSLRIIENRDSEC